MATAAVLTLFAGCQETYDGWVDVSSGCATRRRRVDLWQYGLTPQDGPDRSLEAQILTKRTQSVSVYRDTSARNRAKNSYLVNQNAKLYEKVSLWRGTKQTCFSVLNSDGSFPRPATAQRSPFHGRNLIIGVVGFASQRLFTLYVKKKKQHINLEKMNEWLTFLKQPEFQWWEDLWGILFYHIKPIKGRVGQILLWCHHSRKYPLNVLWARFHL